MDYLDYLGVIYSIDDQTLLNLARLLSKADRLKLFEELYESVGKRPLEKISMRTHIRKTDLYRYLPKTKSKRGGLAPSPANTVKIIRALLVRGHAKFVVTMLDDPAMKLRKSFQKYFFWTRYLRDSNTIYNPLSDIEMENIKRALNFGFSDSRR